MNSPSIQSGNMSMNSLNTSSHNAERIQALAEKLNQIQVSKTVSIDYVRTYYYYSWVFKTTSYQSLRKSTNH